MNLLPALLLTLTTTTLVLRSGDRIAVDGPVREENGVVLFRISGTLYSVPAIDVERLEDVAQPVTVEASKEEADEPRLRLRVSEEERKRLLAKLERNHAGISKPVPLPQVDAEAPPPARPRQSSEELEWRRAAQNHEEAIRRAAEHLALLEARANDLQAKIFSLIALGYTPRQFTYDSSLLARTIEQIPYAQLALTRAERAYDRFREDARRQGVLPGWLR